MQCNSKMQSEVKSVLQRVGKEKYQVSGRQAAHGQCKRAYLALGSPKYCLPLSSSSCMLNRHQVKIIIIIMDRYIFEEHLLDPSHIVTDCDSLHN